MLTLTDFLFEKFPETSPRDFYRDLFPSGFLERKGEYETGKYCAIAIQITKAKAKRYSVTDDLTVIDDLIACDDFCVLSPISYAGKSQKQSNARFMYALTIDLDDLKYDEDGYPIGLQDLWYKMTDILKTSAAPYFSLPVPTYIVSSGHGLHLYYMFTKPIPLYKNVIEQLSKLRHELIRKIWNDDVTELWNNRQYESVTQSFRMVGTITKTGTRVRAFNTGGKVTLDYLNSFVAPEHRVTTFTYESTLSLEEAKEKYPDWYTKRIVEKRPRGTWTCKRDLYDWWKRRLSEVQEGHRYFAIMSLAIYARKSGISRDELEHDAYALIDFMEEKTSHENNHFTRADVTKALEAYNAEYQTFPRKDIEKLTGITIPPNKRNGRKQKDHMKYLNGLRKMRRDVLGEDEYKNNRRPFNSGTKKNIVQSWRADNPNGKKIQCERETGLSPKTIRKWWNAE